MARAKHNPASKPASTKAPGRAGSPKEPGADRTAAGAAAPVGRRQKRSDDADAFIPDPSNDGPAHADDDLAEVLAEDFLESATRGNDVFEDEVDRSLPDEVGGPFVVTDAEDEMAEGTDESNPADAEPAGRPRAVAGLVQRPRAEELAEDQDEDDEDEDDEDDDDEDDDEVEDEVEEHDRPPKR
jgi:hypothetical protein